MEAEVTQAKPLELLRNALVSMLHGAEAARVGFLGDVIFGYQEFSTLERLLSRTVILARSENQFFHVMSDLESRGLREALDYIFVAKPFNVASAEGWRRVEGYPFGILQLDLRGSGRSDELPWSEILSLQRVEQGRFIVCGYLSGSVHSAIKRATAFPVRGLFTVDGYTALTVGPGEV